MVVCKKCGNQFDENFNICPMCGTRYASDNTVDAAQVTVPEQQPTVILEKNTQKQPVSDGTFTEDASPYNSAAAPDAGITAYTYNDNYYESSASNDHTVPAKGRSKSPMIALISVGAFFLLCAIAAVIVIFTQPDLNTRIQEQVSAADEYMENEDYEAAVQEYKAAVENDPTDPKLYLKLADAYTALNDRANTIKTLRAGYFRTKDDTIKKRLDEMTSSRFYDDDDGSWESSWYDNYYGSGSPERKL